MYREVRHDRKFTAYLQREPFTTAGQITHRRKCKIQTYLDAAFFYVCGCFFILGFQNRRSRSNCLAVFLGTSDWRD